VTDEKRPPYGTEVAHPDAKAGVEVGGGEKAAATKTDQRRSMNDQDDAPEPANPEDEDEAQSPT
jgi:hypothetical protein